MTELFGRVVKKKFVNSESNSLRYLLIFDSAETFEEFSPSNYVVFVLLLVYR